MDAFETPYEDEADFIQCTVCDKSMKGETLYKIHVTTPGHIKKEEECVAGGLAVKQQTVPVFVDILQYLEYLKLDEPIIGLNYLEELAGSDLLSGPQYSCTLCHQSANLYETVRHVIGRKHRQKYVELKRPDLVTWDKQNLTSQGGKIMRARAQIIERQDGRGTPKRLMIKRTVGRPNFPAPPRQNQNRGQNIPRRPTQWDKPSNQTGHVDHQDKYPHKERFPSGNLNIPPFRQEEPSYMVSKDGLRHQQGDMLGRDCMEGDLQRPDYRGSDPYRREYMALDYQREYEGKHDDPQRRAPLEPGGGPRFDSREEMPYGSAQRKDYYPDEAPPYRKPFPERDALKEFLTEVRERQSGSAERQPFGNLEAGDLRWSLEQDSGRGGGLGQSGAEVGRGVFPAQIEVGRGDSVFKSIREYPGEMRKPLQEEAVMSPGPSRAGSFQPQRQMEVSRTVSDIPEPFRRFLKGPSSEEQQTIKRKRKSRFSDASAEEVKTTKTLFSDEFGPPNPKVGSFPGNIGVPQRPEVHGTRLPDRYFQSQSTSQTEMDQSGDSDSGNVFNMLKNIDIENVEEANFLKNKLCDLLIEFKRKKSEKTPTQNSQGQAAMSRDFDSFTPRAPESAPRHQYEPATRQDSDHRRSQGPYFQEDQRGRGREQEKLIPDKRLQEFHREESRLPNRSHYEDDFGWQKDSRTPHSSLPNKQSSFSERFEEPRPSRDYFRGPSAYPDSYTPDPHLHFEQAPWMNRGPRYTKSIDKITSTLLELVSRK